MSGIIRCLFWCVLAVFFVSSIVTSYEFVEKEKQDQVIAASPSSHRYADIYGLSDQQSKWWEVQQTNETLFDGLDKYHIYLRFSDIDDGGIHSCYQYQLVLRTTKAIEYVNTFCYPSLVITAYRKSGSSAAYSLISRYPHVVTTYTKENCPYILGVSLVQYFESLPTQVESGELILDGCVDLKGNMKMRAILHEPNTLYLVMTRNYADWIWSAYNYWCQPHYDGRSCDVGTYWVEIEKEHVRSAEIFRDIVQGPLNGTKIASPLLFDNPCEHSKHLFQIILDYLWTYVEPAKTLVLASEELETHPVITWNRIMKAIGLSTPHPGLKDFMGQRVNSGNVKGAGSTISVSDYKPGLYAISNNQPIMEETRETLNKCWKQDCIYTSLVTNHNYSACSAEQELAKPETISMYTSNQSYTNMTRYLNEVAKPIKEQPAFLFLQHARCNESFHTKWNAPGSQAALTSPFASVVSPSSGASGPDSAPSRALTSTSTTSPEVIRGVAIVSPSTKDRALLRKLLYFATGYQDIVDLEEAKHMHHTLKTVCHQPFVIVTAPPSILQVGGNKKSNSSSSSSSSSEQPHLYFDRLDSVCGQRRVVFEHVVILMRDALNAVWTTYQLNHGYPNGILVAGIAASFNWTDWELSAVQMLMSQRNTTAVQNADFNVWTAEQSEMLEEIPRSHKFNSRMEKLLYSDTKVFHLYELIEFLKEGLVLASHGGHISSGSGVAHRLLNTLNHKQSHHHHHHHNDHHSHDPKKLDAMKALPILQSNKDWLQCAHTLYKGGGLSRRDQLVGAGNLNLAYASNDLVCQIEHLFKNSKLMISTLESSSTYNASCVNGVSMNKDISRKCQLRYTQRGLIKNIEHHPVALLVRGGTEQMLHSRLLWEYNTGLQSGAMETDKRLSRWLAGEVFCGLRLSIIHADPYDTTIKSTKGGKPTISMTNKGKQKCRKGMVRGFDKGALVAQDPFATVWLRYRTSIMGNMTQYVDSTPTPVARVIGQHKEYAQIVRGLSKVEKANMKDGLLAHARKFVEADLNLYTSLWDIKFNNFKQEDILVLSYEALMMVPYNHSSDDVLTMPRSDVLTELLTFGNYPIVSREKLQCSYNLLPKSAYSQEMTLMDQFYRSEPALLCELHTIFNTVLDTYKDIRFLRLFTDVQC